MNREEDRPQDTDSDKADAESRSDVESPKGRSDSHPKIEDLYKSDVDRQLWAPAVDLVEEARIERKRLGRWIEAVRSVFRRWLSIR